MIKTKALFILAVITVIGLTGCNLSPVEKELGTLETELSNDSAAQTRAQWQNITKDSNFGPNLKVTKASITRNNFWRRVYFTLEVRYYPGDTWHHIVGEQKLANKETYSKTLNCYQARFLVRTKKSSAFTTTFEYLYE